MAYAGPDAPVKIESVKLSSQQVHGGDSVSGTVITTSNAASVTARVGTIQMAVPKVAPGTFSMEVHVPRLPLLNRQMDIVFTAIRADGASVQLSVPIQVSN